MGRHFIVCILSTIVLCSCGSTKSMTYLQKTSTDSVVTAAKAQEIKLQPYDKISIVVSSRDPKLSALFNLPAVSGTVGNNDSVSVNGVAKYTVDGKGNIDFPVIGSLSVAGLSRDSISKMIKRKLADGQLLADCVVTVEFVNLGLSVLGEVNAPGRYSIDRDCITILDAISMAGDITRHGNRRKVTVMRTENGVQKSYTLNLLSAEDALSSPAYYLRQNDIVYVSNK